MEKRGLQTESKHDKVRAQTRIRVAKYRASQTVEQRQIRLSQRRTSRAEETIEQREIRLSQLRNAASTSRAEETIEQREIRLSQLRVEGEKAPLSSSGPKFYEFDEIKIFSLGCKISEVSTNQPHQSFRMLIRTRKNSDLEWTNIVTY